MGGSSEFLSRGLLENEDAGGIACTFDSCKKSLNAEFEFDGAKVTTAEQQCCIDYLSGKRYRNDVTLKVCRSLEEDFPESSLHLREKYCTGRGFPLWAWAICVVVLLCVVLCILSSLFRCVRNCCCCC